jgi:hypothetical protein
MLSLRFTGKWKPSYVYRLYRHLASRYFSWRCGPPHWHYLHPSRAPNPSRSTARSNSMSDSGYNGNFPIEGLTSSEFVHLRDNYPQSESSCRTPATPATGPTTHSPSSTRPTTGVSRAEAAFYQLPHRPLPSFSWDWRGGKVEGSRGLMSCRQIARHLVWVARAITGDE